MSEAANKRFENTETRKKVSETVKKHFQNPEVRKELSEANKKYFKNPETRKKASGTTKKQLESPEAPGIAMNDCIAFDAASTAPPISPGSARPADMPPINTVRLPGTGPDLTVPRVPLDHPAVLRMAFRYQLPADMRCIVVGRFFSE